MKYKITFKICIGCLLSAVLFFSCKKSLEKNPITEYSTNNFFNEPAQANAALTGAYSLVQNAFNTEFIYYGEARADNLVIALENSSNTINVLNNTLDANMSYSDWGNYYRIINQVNLIIKNLPLMKQKGLYGANDSDYNRVMGQALGLRAYCYFYMTRIWGNVPLITEPTETPNNLKDFQIPRTDTTLVYKQISSDLAMAEALLPRTYSNNQQTHATLTQGAINAIQTDFYMTRNMPDSALVSSAKVINSGTYKLAALYDPSIDYITNQKLIDNAPYSKMFTDGFSDESIFEVAFSYLENNNSGIYGTYGGTFESQFAASDSIISKFDLNDLRLITDFRNDNYVYKFFPKVGFDKITQNDKNVILYRLADIMLLRAEALNTVGRRDDSFKLVNQIRERAGVPAIDATVYNAYTREQAEDFILDERDRELCFEGKRFFDLVRTGRIFKVMKPINGLSDPQNVLWPINLSIIRENPQIVQNQFYK